MFFLEFLFYINLYYFLKRSFYIIKNSQKKRTKNYHFRNAYKMGRPSIRVKLTITSKDDSRFLEPRTFNNIPDASFGSGLTDRGIRAAYHSKRELMRNRSGEVYNFEWKEPDPIRVKPPQSGAPPWPPRTVAKECVKCSKTLTHEEKSLLFRLD